MNRSYKLPMAGNTDYYRTTLAKECGATAWLGFTYDKKYARSRQRQREKRQDGGRVEGEEQPSHHKRPIKNPTTERAEKKNKVRHTTRRGFDCISSHWAGLRGAPCRMTLSAFVCPAVCKPSAARCPIVGSVPQIACSRLLGRGMYISQKEKGGREGEGLRALLPVCTSCPKFP